MVRAVALGQIKGGKLEGLGVTALKRTPLAPNLAAFSTIGPEPFGQFIKVEIAKWARDAREAGMQPE